MRLSPFILLVLAAAGTAAAQPQPPARAQAAPPAAAPPGAPDTTSCSRNLYRHARETPPRAQARRLGELPPGDLQLTVIRRIGECYGPVTVRENYGAVQGDDRR
jgi:hypothetical protein